MGLPEYAVYKGDEFICIGTRKELAKKFNVSINTVQFWNTPANKRRIEKRKGRKGGNSQGILTIKIDDGM